MSAVGAGSLRRRLCDDHQFWDPVLRAAAHAQPFARRRCGSGDLGGYRLFAPETYRYAQTLCERLGTRLVVAQSSVSPARMEALHGRLWESGLEEDMDLYLRLRKVEPLEKALDQGAVRCWASGVRRGQTDLRKTMTVLDPIRDRLSLRPFLVGPIGMSSITCRSMSFRSILCSIRGIPLLGIGIPVLPMAWKWKGAAPVSADRGRSAETTSPGRWAMASDQGGSAALTAYWQHALALG